MIKQVLIDLLSDQSNGSVIQLPGRQFPGLVIQGDTLLILHEDLLEILEYDLPEEVKDDLEDIVSRVRSMLDRYKTVVISEGRELPFRA